jgi:hypothetical protein
VFFIKKMRTRRIEGKQTKKGRNEEEKDVCRSGRCTLKYTGTKEWEKSKNGLNRHYRCLLDCLRCKYARNGPPDEFIPVCGDVRMACYINTPVNQLAVLPYTVQGKSPL